MNLAKTQYLENSNENVDVVVFGHTHVPTYRDTGDGKYYLNDGTWIDHNTDYPDATRTLAVITTGDKDTAALYSFMEDGSLRDISASGSKAKGPEGKKISCATWPCGLACATAPIIA